MPSDVDVAHRRPPRAHLAAQHVRRRERDQDQQQRVRRGRAVADRGRVRPELRGQRAWCRSAPGCKVAVSSVLTARNASAAPAPSPGATRGTVTRRNVAHADWPRLRETWSSSAGACSSELRTLTTARGRNRIAYAAQQHRQGLVEDGVQRIDTADQCERDHDAGQRVGGVRAALQEDRDRRRAAARRARPAPSRAPWSARRPPTASAERARRAPARRRPSTNSVEEPTTSQRTRA